MSMGNSPKRTASTDYLGEPDEVEEHAGFNNEEETSQDDNNIEESDENVDEEQSAEIVDEEEVSENVDEEESDENVVQDESPVESQDTQQDSPLSSIPVNDKNGAFQLLIAFINLAYARGAYKQDEVEKIIECINKFVV
jgi:hypothetical protein